MDPKTRYQQERNEGKEQRAIAIVEAATVVFVKKGIEKTTMQDVAKEANIGIATLFRYFAKKEKLVVAVAAKEVGNINATFRTVAAEPGSALEKIERLIDYFIADLERDNPITKFMEDFESYAAHSLEPLEDIESFNEIYRATSREYAKIIRQGQEDGSIRSDLPTAETLTTIINVFGIFSRKLSLQNNILTFVSDLEAGRQLEILKRITLDYLGNRS